MVWSHYHIIFHVNFLFQLARDGQFLRMIPSLSGGLYQFNGENVEVIPFTADDLLQSSFFFKDDLVLTGIIILL